MTDSGRTVELKDISFRQAWPIKHMQAGGGLLPNTAEAAALWQFLICAFQALDRVPAQVTLIGTPDQQVDLMQVAHSIRKIYELESLDGMFQKQLVRTAREEALATRLPWNSRINLFFSTGGKEGNLLDRDADRVGQ